MTVMQRELNAAVLAVSQLREVQEYGNLITRKDLEEYCYPAIEAAGPTLDPEAAYVAMMRNQKVQPYLNAGFITPATVRKIVDVAIAAARKVRKP